MTTCSRCGTPIDEAVKFCSNCGAAASQVSQVASPGDFLTFNKMITPTIIQILFWILAGLVIILGLIGIVNGATSNFAGGSQVLGGLLLLLLGPVVIRVYCEILIVVFRMNETLIEIRDSLSKHQQGAAGVS